MNSPTAAATIPYTGPRPGYELPMPDFWRPDSVSQMQRYVDYHGVEAAALGARKQHSVKLASTDRMKFALLGIDWQLTFCDPKGQLYVGGRSGTGAIDDSRRTCEFIYRNARVINKVIGSLDTHTRAQIFHCAWWVDINGNEAPPYTLISYDEVKSGKWRFNPAIAFSVAGNANAVGYLQEYSLHYVKTLTESGKYLLMVWPYHGILGGIEHALVPAIHEAAWYHNALRESETGHEIKGGNPLSENYAVTHPEVLIDHKGKAIAALNQRFLGLLLNYDVVAIAGQAKSHCVAWTIDGILEQILKSDPKLAQKIYLLDDLTSPVVTPQIDFTDMADAAFKRFSDAGMHVVNSTLPINQWPGVAGQLAA